MYETIQEVILSGSFELMDMLNKIDTLWVEGYFTDEEREELRDLARENANPVESMAPLEKRVEALELRVKALEESGVDPEPEPETPEEWKQPAGAHDAYNTGDRVTYKGKVYESTINGNVWPPDAYPQGWKEVK